jgi:hypothetical protein
MGKWLRRIRGAIGMGLAWGAAWASMGFFPRWVLGLDSDLPFPILFAGLGFIAGVTFSGVLVMTEGRRRFDQMSLRRFAAWGAAGGLLIGVLFVRGVYTGWAELLGFPAMFVIASSACAAGSLALARRVTGRDLSDGRGDTVDAALPPHEKRELRGGGE